MGYYLEGFHIEFGQLTSKQHGGRAWAGRWLGANNASVIGPDTAIHQAHDPSEARGPRILPRMCTGERGLGNGY